MNDRVQVDDPRVQVDDPTRMKYKGNIRMMPGRVLVRRKSSDKETEGGILIPDISQKKLNEGYVVRAGVPLEENWNENAPKITGGEYILFTPCGAADVKIAGEDFLVISLPDIFMALG